ncbi:collagen alpha-1(I) chain-like isoform X2 [Cynocephalus volans]|uniref:collagen alpha-1(I) chain-like isoform X2 n=1 Tax=Cynocephalus volans TaxID=110931 RepID=UPI002FC88379
MRHVFSVTPAAPAGTTDMDDLPCCMQQAAWGPQSSETGGGRTPVDAQALRRKMGRTTCGAAARAILGSLLLYVAGQGQAGQGRERRPPEPQPRGDPRRPTRFQLLRAKFLGAGREPRLRRAREVGRLIARDRPGPGRGLVSATIGKLLAKSGDRAGSPVARDQPRWRHAAGKSAVRSILQLFLAAEQKEAAEREARGRPPVPRPPVAGGVRPRLAGGSWALCRPRDKSERSGGLCAESQARGGRRVHRPELRALHAATAARTCVTTPPARFVACTAEPLPAFSIATAVGGPGSRLSHCAKISPADARWRPRKETSVSPCVGDTEPGGNSTPGGGPAGEEPRGQLRPSTSPRPPAMVHGDRHAALNSTFPSAGPEHVPEPGSSCASCESQASLGRLPVVAPPRPVGPAGGARTVDPRAASATVSIQEVKEARAAQPPGTGDGTGDTPEVTMTVCSSKDETQRAIPDPEAEPLFASQEYFPEQKAPGHIPPLPVPAAQATRRTQSAIEPPQVTVQLPVVHEMPAAAATPQRAGSREDQHSRTCGGESVIENAPTVLPAVTGDRRDAHAPAKLSQPAQVPGRIDAPPAPGRQARRGPTLPGGASGAGRGIPETLLTPKPQGSAGRKENGRSSENVSEIGNHSSAAGAGAGLVGWQQEAAHSTGTSPDTPVAGASPPEGSTSSASGGRQGPSPSDKSPAGPPAWQAPATGCARSESFTELGKNVPCKREEPKRPLSTESTRQRQMAEENASHRFGENRLSSFDEQPKSSVKASRVMAVSGSPTRPSPGSAHNPGNSVAEEPDTAGEEEHRASPARCLAADTRSLEGEGPPPGPSLCHLLAPRGSSKHKSRAAERSILEDMGPNLSSAPVSPAPHPGAAVTTALLLDKPRFCVSNALAASKSDASVRSGRSTAVAGGPLGNCTKSQIPTSTYPTPQDESTVGPQSHGVGKPQPPPVHQQAKVKKRVEPERRHPFDPELTHPFPTVPPVEVSARQVERARMRELPALQPRWSPAAGTGAMLRTGTPEAEHMGSAAQECGPTQANVRGQGTHHGPERTISGPVRSQQTQELDGSGKRKTAPSGQNAVLLTTEEPRKRSAQDLAGAKKMGAEMKSSCQQGDRGQEQAPALGVQLVRSSVRGHGARASESQAAPAGSPERPEGLAAGGQARGQVQAHEMVPQAWEQPIGGTGKGAPMAGRGGKLNRPATRDGVWQEAGTQHLPQGSQPLAAKSAAASPLEPGNSSAVPTPYAEGHQTLLPQAQEGLPNHPRAEGDPRAARSPSEQEHRKVVHFAKYKAQSFSDQRSFDLSFRRTSIKAPDTLELPK